MAPYFDDEDLEKIDLGSPITEYEPEIYDDDEDYNIQDDEEEEVNSNLSKIVQIILLSAIAVILFTSIFLLVRWQRGSAPDVTDNNGNPAYDVESADYFVPFNPSAIEGYVDDGEKNIVILGDDTILHAQGENGISDLLAEATGANVTTLALSGSTIALQELSYTQEYAEDAYNLYYIISAICAGDMGNYDLQFSALNEIEDNSVYYDYWDKLHVIDFDKTDTLIICYGYCDYLAGRPLTAGDVYGGQPYGHENGTAGSLDDCLKLLRARFPYMQIIISSPSYCFVTDENGEMIGADVYFNSERATMGDYVLNAKNAAESNHVSFVDNYFFEHYNYANHEDYLEENGAFPNEAGRRLIVAHIMEFINES
ncbi:MAG: hypothetical protein K2K17_02540 [Lachnospiraceae bacterium]|nr:hypothetical protein [Lachnospiraceae bacterium]